MKKYVPREEKYPVFATCYNKPPARTLILKNCASGDVNLAETDITKLDPFIRELMNQTLDVKEDPKPNITETAPSEQEEKK